MNNFFYTICDENGYELDILNLSDKKNKKLWPHTEISCHIKVLQYAIDNNLNVKYKKIYLGFFKSNIDPEFTNFINRELLVSDGV